MITGFYMRWALPGDDQSGGMVYQMIEKKPVR
jgi:hypothetical protein